MFEDILLGIMSILFGIGLFAFGIFTTHQKIGDYDFYDGEVTSVNPETRNITVNYKADDIFYSVSYHISDLFRFISDNIPDIEDMPEVGLKVRVMTYSGNPQIVFTVHFQREMGRGTSGKHKYIDNNSLKTRKKSILFGIAYIVGGIFYLLISLNII